MKRSDKLCGQTIGWREWVGFPKLKINSIKAKIDTGARTSALHASDINVYKKNNQDMVAFTIFPIQRNSTKKIKCTAKIHDLRTVKNSGGKQETRITILTELLIGTKSSKIELTLTNRDSMGFRLLLGRTAVKDNFLISPGKSFLLGKK